MTLCEIAQLEPVQKGARIRRKHGFPVYFDVSGAAYREIGGHHQVYLIMKNDLLADDWELAKVE